MGFKLVDEQNDETLLRVAGGPDDAATWMNLVDSVTRCWIGRFNGVAPRAASVPLWRRLAPMLVTLAAGATMTACTTVTIDTARAEMDPSYVPAHEIVVEYAAALWGGTGNESLTAGQSQ